MNSIEVDYTEMEMKLKCYIDRGRVAGAAEVRNEPLIAVKPDASLIKPLKKIDLYTGSFIAVDCSTRTLKRANNWGVYLMRASSAAVRGRSVDWNYIERICTVVGDAHGKIDYGLPSPSNLTEMDKHLKQLSEQNKLTLE